MTTTHLHPDLHDAWPAPVSLAQARREQEWDDRVAQALCLLLICARRNCPEVFDTALRQVGATSRHRLQFAQLVDAVIGERI
jgi:hypothetical protein